MTISYIYIYVFPFCFLFPFSPFCTQMEFFFWSVATTHCPTVPSQSVFVLGSYAHGVDFPCRTNCHTPSLLTVARLACVSALSVCSALSDVSVLETETGPSASP